LPLFKWTSNYKSFLESRLKVNKSDNDKDIEEFKELHSNNNIHFHITFTPGKLDQIIASEGICKNLKLSFLSK